MKARHIPFRPGASHSTNTQVSRTILTFRQYKRAEPSLKQNTSIRIFHPANHNIKIRYNNWIRNVSALLSLTIQGRHTVLKLQALTTQMVQLKDLATQAAPLQEVWFSFPCFTAHEKQPTFHVFAMHFYNDREYLGKISETAWRRVAVTSRHHNKMPKPAYVQFFHSKCRIYEKGEIITLVNKDFVPRGKMSVSDVFLDTEFKYGSRISLSPTHFAPG
jgi:hypothetical protein